MLQLRPYQEDAVSAVMAELKSGKNPLLHLSTGGGKTEVFFEVCKRFLAERPNAPICILLNRVLLLDQTIRRIEKIFPRELIGVVCGTRNRRVYAPITVATIGSVQKDKKFGLVICDESHRVTVNNKDSSYMRFLTSQPLVMGVTATPWRFDGHIYGDNSPIWKKLTYTKPLSEMIGEGWLVKPIIRKSKEEYDLSGVRTVMGDYAQDELSTRVEDKTKISKQVTDALDKAHDRKHIVWVCVSIKHSELIMEELQARGESCAIVHSLLTNTQIEAFKNGFENGHSRHIVSVSMLCEGLDIPCIDCIVMCRPTKSSSLWVQVAGRALRPSPGKENALILDYGRVAENCGPLDEPIIRGKGRGNVIQTAPPMKFCASCLAYISASARTCPECGYNYPPPEPSRNLTERAGDAPLLKADIVPKIIDVNPIVAVNMHQGKKVKCVKITFHPKNLFARDVYDFAFDFNIHRKLRRIGINNVYTVADAEKYDGTKINSGVDKIKIDYSGAYPEVVEVFRSEI